MLGMFDYSVTVSWGNKSLLSTCTVYKHCKGIAPSEEEKVRMSTVQVVNKELFPSATNSRFVTSDTSAVARSIGL